MFELGKIDSMPAYIQDYADRRFIQTNKRRKSVHGLAIATNPMLEMAARLEHMVAHHQMTLHVARYTLCEAYPDCNTPAYYDWSAINLIKDLPGCLREPLTMEPMKARLKREGKI